MSRRTLLALPLAGLVAAGLMAGSALADPGVSNHSILFGQSTAFDGLASSLGLGMRKAGLTMF